jgi:hypothetical protein
MGFGLFNGSAKAVRKAIPIAEVIEAARKKGLV